MRCPSDKCGSMNVQQLSAYWLSLPAESPLRRRLAQPEEAASRLFLAICVAAAGLYVATSADMLPLGVLLIAAGVLWAVWSSRQVSAAEARREAWARSLYCLTCTGRFMPEQGRLQ